MSFRRGHLYLLALLLAASLPVGIRAHANQSADDSHKAQDQDNDQPKDQARQNQSQTNDSSASTTRLRVKVTTKDDKPVSNASVYVRFPTSGGVFHHDKLAEMDLKTNQDGSVKVPEIPQGKVMIQVVAPGWHTFGKWYDIAQPEQTISIQLEPPPHWY